MYVVMKNRLEVQRSRKQIYRAWDDDFEIENELAKSTNSPKIYDLKTPQRKSKITEMVFDVTFDRPDKPFSDQYMHDKRNLDSKTYQTYYFYKTCISSYFKTH